MISPDDKDESSPAEDVASEVVLQICRKIKKCRKIRKNAPGGAAKLKINKL